MNPQYSSSSSIYVDEEDCLGFKIWVAELELLVGSSRTKKRPDAGQAFQLLQKLIVTLDRTERAEVKEYQRRCEDALIDILLKGAPPPVRRLICDTLGKLYSAGDQLPLYSRVSSLQLFLGTSEAFSKETSADVRLGALELTASLYYSQGRSLSIGVLETAITASKHALKGSDDRTRCAALTLLAAAVEGVGGTHRGAAQVQHEAFKTVEKLIKDKDHGDSVRLAVGDLIRAIAAAGGAHFWANGLTSYEAARTACLTGITDPVPAVRAAFAKALGETAIASASQAAKDSVAAAGSKPKHHQAQEKALAAVPHQCLSTPFREAVVASNRLVCTAIAQAWVQYLTATRVACGQDEAPFMDPAMSIIDALNAACIASGGTPEKAPSGLDELGCGGANGERPHAQACALYALRAGVIEQLAEGGQRLLLERVTALLSNEIESSQPAVAVVALETAALVTEALGEIGAEAAAALEPLITAKLSAPQQSVRLQAASALAALVVAEQGSAARLLRTAIQGVTSAVHALASAAEAAAGVKGKPPVVPSTPRGLGTSKMKLEMDAVHGWAAGVAALLGASVRLDMGLPSACATSALTLVVQLIATPKSASKFPAAAAVEREAGYVVLGALCQIAQQEVIEAMGMSRLLDLWAPALAEKEAQALTELYASNISYLEHAVAAELWWRCAALHSLAALITGLMHSSHASRTLEKTLALMLRSMLEMVSNHPALSDPARAKGGPSGPLAAAAGTAQLRLMQAYSCLSTPSAYGADHEALTKLCLRSVRGAATSGQLDLIIPALKDVLSRRDDVLGPWTEGLDPTERALLSFSGVPGGPHTTACTSGRRSGTGYAAPEPVGPPGHGASMSGASSVAANASASVSLTSPLAGGAPGFSAPTVDAQSLPMFEVELGPFPQPLGLAPAMLAAHIRLLGRMLPALSPENQAAVLGSLASAARGNPSDTKVSEMVKAGASLVVAAAALAGLTRIAPNAEGAEALSAAAQGLAEHVVQFASFSPAAQRAAADLYACAARLGSDATALALVKSLCKEAAETTSLPRRASLSLAVGAVCQAVGGLGLPTVLPTAARTLVAVIEASDKSIAPWGLQALLACADAAGPAFVPYIKEILKLCQSVVLSEEIYTTRGLLPAVGRLVNASVAILGPEYTLGSAAYEACRGLVAEMRASPTSTGVDPGDALYASLEVVLYAQMLVLFAPGALPASHHVAVLLSTLPSRQPKLRRAAADTLRHLAERDPHAMLAEHVEPALLQAVDVETDPGTAAQLKATIWTLCAVGASTNPSKWVSLFAGIVTAAHTAGEEDVEESPGAESAGGQQRGSDDEDEGYEEERRNKRHVSATTSAPAPSSASKPGGAGSGAQPGGAAKTSSALTPRLRTRQFAARCLLRIPDIACSADERHMDYAYAIQNQQQGDWLVLKVQKLVDLGFKITTGQMEALRPLGVELLYQTLMHFGATPDPVIEGSTLMAQYQAQLVSALRTSLAATASPVLQASGAALAAAFLDQGLAQGDDAVMSRMMGLLGDLLSQTQEKGAESYAEWVGARARVALLEAHAHCAVLGGLQAQRSHLRELMRAWIGLLHDEAAISMLPPDAPPTYRLSVMVNGTASNASTSTTTSSTTATPQVVASISKAWPVALNAATLALCAVPAVADSPAGRDHHAALLDFTLASLHTLFVSPNALQQQASADIDMNIVKDQEAGNGGLVRGGTRGKSAELLLVLLTALHRLTGSECSQRQWISADRVTESTAALSEALACTIFTTPAVEKAASTLRQLAALCVPIGSENEAGAVGSDSQEALLAVAEQCLQLRSEFSSAQAVADALSSCVSLATTTKNGGKQVIADAQRLHKVLSMAVRVLGSAAHSHEDELFAAADTIRNLAPLAATNTVTTLNHNDKDGPSVIEVAVGCCGSVEEVLDRAVAAKDAPRVAACITCLLPLTASTTGGGGEKRGYDGAIDGIDVSSSQPVSTAASGEINEDDWGDADFTSAADHTPTTANTSSVSNDMAALALDINAHAEAAVQRSVLAAVEGAVQCGDARVKSRALSAVKVHLQRDGPAVVWGGAVVAAVLPGAAEHAQHVLTTNPSTHSEMEIQAVVEMLEISQAGAHLSPLVAPSILTVTVPLLIEAAAPASAPLPAITSTALRVLGALGSGSAAGPFRETVAALPVAVKQRLQAALMASAPAGGAGGGAVGGGGSRPPAIQLKNFAALKK